MNKRCPHCFGTFDINEGVQTSGGLICSNCAYGPAVWAALSEWKSSRLKKSFAEWMLESIGYEVSEDFGRPGVWSWVNDDSTSDISFSSKEDAIEAAQKHAVYYYHD
jgi:hypothetical protein